MFLLNSLSKVDSTPLNVMIVSGIFWNFVYSTYLTTWPRVWFPPCASRFQCQRPFRFQPGRENLLLRLSWNWGARRGRRLQPREPRCRRTLRRSNKSRNTRKSKDLLISSSFFELTNSFSLTWYVSFMQNGVVGVMRIQISVPAFSWQWRRRRGGGGWQQCVFHRLWQYGHPLCSGWCYSSSHRSGRCYHCPLCW